MNLIKDIWLPVIRKDGMREKIAIWQILESYKENPVIDIEAPRPDFRNAIYQLLIGIVQVAAMPEDEEDWVELWKKPYSAVEFKKKILVYEDCFEIDSDGPAFMQDYSLEEFKEETLTNIFIELPSNEHFQKNEPHQVNVYWAAITLYALQTFGPAGGRGHKTGLRGGGPMTTIIWPECQEGESLSLWHRLWINVIPEEYIPNLTGNIKKKNKADIFPWMKPTKISSSKGSGLYPQECHPFHMFFGMPRRIRFIFENRDGVCDVSGEKSPKLVTGYKTFHSGNDYSGAWLHPLNSYRKDIKKLEEPPYSIKGQPGGITYRYWPRLALYCDSKSDIPAQVVRFSQTSSERKKILSKHSVRLWAAGYDLSNMKARCWYEAEMPYFSLELHEAKELEEVVNIFLVFASDCSTGLVYRIKESWFRSPKDANGDFSYITNSFWQNTESDFYTILDRLVKNIFDNKNVSECASDWKLKIINQALELFDTWALSGQEDGLDMKRVIGARNGLKRAIFGSAKKYLNNKIVNE